MHEVLHVLFHLWEVEHFLKTFIRLFDTSMSLHGGHVVLRNNEVVELTGDVSVETF